MEIITILSGKGGTGKTSLTGSLAVLLAGKRKTIAVDCDVDAPNMGLCLGLLDKDFFWKKVQTSEKAELVKEKCIGCKSCLDVCNFGAISWDEKKRNPVFDRFLCEGCGACQLICEQGAIKLKKIENGRVGLGKTKYGFDLISGQLEVGESGSGKIVTLIKNKAEEKARKEKVEVMLVDSAAGIGCPVIASIQGSDFIVAVTEPTPSALNDLKRALSVVEHFRIPYGIVINKFDLDKEFSKKIEIFAKEKGILVLGKIPYDKVFVEALVNLKPVVVYEKKYERLFREIIDKLHKIINS